MKSDINLQKKILEYIEQNGKMPHDGESIALYQKWRISNERFILENMNDKELNEIPEEYREFIKKMREYGYGVEENLQKEILEYIKGNGKLPNTRHKNGKELYKKWWPSDEKSVLKICEGESIEKVPEKYREFVKKMREYGYGIKKKTIGEEILEFIENKKRMPKGFIKEESSLYARWFVSSEKRALEIFHGKSIEDVPKKYRGFVEKIRNYGLEKSDKVRTKSDPEIQKELLEFIEENGVMPHDGESLSLYQKWRISNERFILENMKDKELSEIPEEYREFIKKMREYGYGVEENLQKEILEYIKGNGKLPNTRHKNGKELYKKWWPSDEKSVLKICEGESIEKVPEKYREFVKKMREYGYGIKKKTIGEEILEFIENKKRMPKGFIKEESSLYARWFVSSEKRALEIFHGKSIEDVPENYRNFVKKMRIYEETIKTSKEQKRRIKGTFNSDKIQINKRYKVKNKSFQKEILEYIEKNGKMPHAGESLSLYQKWRRSNEKFILENMKDKELSEIPKEYRQFIKKMREYEYGGEEENIQKKILEFIEKNGKLPNSKMANGKELYQRWWGSDEKSVLKIYEGEPIEKVPEKYREFVRKMREYGYGIKIGDEILEFIKNKKRLPIVSIKEENGLYIKWLNSDEKKAWTIYDGKPIEDVPENYRNFVKKMREHEEIYKQNKANSQSNTLTDSDEEFGKIEDIEQIERPYKNEKDDNKYLDLNKLSDEELDKYINDIEIKQRENEKKIEKLKKIKKLMELSKKLDAEIEELENQINAKEGSEFYE